MKPDFAPNVDPLALFAAWLTEAEASEPNDPGAMTLATVDPDGRPDARIVLLKDFDDRGFVFYSNRGSAKGRQLAARPEAALLFHWKTLRRQVRVRGSVSSASVEEADAYFASRPRESRIGAWASRQSAPLAARAELEEAVARYVAEFGEGPVPRPEHWVGYRLAPREIELWEDRPHRLHERILFTRTDGGWTGTRLHP
ncbi:MAG: pyridoxamine 5'-phosphate oxidase [Bauldia sp.]|nr:pyridoxamine 5'-phosphate oxidase [Bauldia sp.]